MKEDYMQGFDAGFRLGMQLVGRNYSPDTLSAAIQELGAEEIALSQYKTKPKKRRRQTPKQRLLTEMTKKKWNKYKKGSGKKTYVQIRAQVARSAEFKRKAKRLK